MINKIPNCIESLVINYVNELKRNFTEKIYGVYIYNSTALGAFDEKRSDIDFLVIINEDFNGDEILVLKDIHNELSNKYIYATKMEGMYIRRDDIGKLNSEIKPYLYFYDGKLNGYGYYDINYVTWWTLTNKGIAINSPEIHTLDLNVSWDNIIETMEYNLNEYWREKLGQKDIFLEDEWIEFAVVTLSRIYYTIMEKGITSKQQACIYSIDRLPAQFTNIISEGIRIRNDVNKNSLYSNNISREKDIKDFGNYMIKCCNEKIRP